MMKRSGSFKYANLKFYFGIRKHSTLAFSVSRVNLLHKFITSFVTQGPVNCDQSLCYTKFVTLLHKDLWEITLSRQASKVLRPFYGLNIDLIIYYY